MLQRTGQRLRWSFHDNQSSASICARVTQRSIPKFLILNFGIEDKQRSASSQKRVAPNFTDQTEFPEICGAGLHLFPFHFPIALLEGRVVLFIALASVGNYHDRKTKEEVPVLRIQKRHANKSQADEECEQACTFFRNPFPNHRAPM
jgi:hypothetical protein